MRALDFKGQLSNVNIRLVNRVHFYDAGTLLKICELTEWRGEEESCQHVLFSIVPLFILLHAGNVRCLQHWGERGEFHSFLMYYVISGLATKQLQMPQMHLDLDFWYLFTSAEIPPANQLHRLNSNCYLLVCKMCFHAGCEGCNWKFTWLALFSVFTGW